MTTANEYYEIIRRKFSEVENPEIAVQQSRYMKHLFEYFGLKAPSWQGMLKELFTQYGILHGEDLIDFIELCFADDHREMQYAAIEMAQKAVKKEQENYIEVIEFMIINKSWWDSVDWISSGIAGAFFLRFPHMIVPITERWMHSGNIWLQRAAIIFQLKYKNKTNLDLLGKYILSVAASKEFFLRKAAGWALRTVSYFNPAFVSTFVKENPHLSNLTKKEAMRIILKRKNLNTF